jgi:putative ABC transport system permease protein
LLLALLSLPLGLALTWTLLAVVNVEAAFVAGCQYVSVPGYSRLAVFAVIAAVLGPPTGCAHAP